MTAPEEKLPSVVFRLGHMGDVALTTGVLARWHELSGETYVFVTRRANLPLFENHPAVAEAIGLEDADLEGFAWYARAGELARRYQGHGLVDLHGTLRSRILALLWKGGVLRYPKFGLTRRLFALTRSAALRARLESLNVPQRYALALEETAPEPGQVTPQIFLTDAERAEVAPLMPPRGEDRPLVALHPYATHPAKQWPSMNWLALIDLLDAARIDWFVVGRSATPLRDGNERDLTNRTDLRQTCALLSKADVLVTGDSGPMHLASGVRTPVVALFGPTSRAWGFYPTGPLDMVLERDLKCRPCSLHGARNCVRGFECMAGTSPEAVLRAVQDILE